MECVYVLVLHCLCVCAVGFEGVEGYSSNGRANEAIGVCVCVCVCVWYGYQ